MTDGMRPILDGVPHAVLRRKCACGNHMMAGGSECVECRKKKRLGLQTKLTINARGDAYEQEADRIADQVMAMAAHSTVNGVPPRIQRFSGQLNGQMDMALASVDQVLASPGRPLEPALRKEMEQRFGHDFSRVRVHTGTTAEQSARDVNAQAYTVGHNMVFGGGKFAPGTQEGRWLIAHELTHVVQQGRAAWSGTLTIGGSDTPYKHEARNATQMEQSSPIGSLPVTSTISSGLIQRQQAPELGGLFLRRRDDGRIEILAGTPNLPVTGPLGVGIRCQNGRCQPVAGQNPSDLENRTYSVQEALDLLGGSASPTPSPTGAGCPPARQIPQLAACCPVGMLWDGSACVPLTGVPLCLPTQITPRGTCCPLGEQWDYNARRCAPPSVPTSQSGSQRPQLTLPRLEVSTTPIRFGTIESSSFDNFRTDDATVPSQHNDGLSHLASLLNIYPEAVVHIEGHTDSTASETHNDRLSINRAESIKAALIARNVVNPGRLHTRGFGEHQLRFYPEHTAADMAGNRRVEVWFHILPSQDLSSQLRLRSPLTLTPGSSGL